MRKSFGFAYITNRIFVPIHQLVTNMRREIYIITLHWTILFIVVYQLSMIWICQKCIFIQCIIRIMKNFFFIYAYIPLCINSPIHREIKQRSKYRHKRCPIQRIKKIIFFSRKNALFILYILQQEKSCEITTYPKCFVRL